MRQLADCAARLQRTPLVCLYGTLAAANVVAWVWALWAFGDRPLLLGTALIAYGLGLRHAVDADHIAAIDAVTRKLRQEGRPPLTLGLYFALGHSTVVTLAVAGIAAGSAVLGESFEELRSIGGIVGPCIAALLLFALAISNLIILRSLWLAFRRLRAGTALAPDELDRLPQGGGFVSRVLKPVFGRVTRPWHMLLLGFLFGLSFDTATEVALLGLSASQAAHGVSVWSIMVFPALFAAGMTLIDTTDGVLMLRACDWAYVKPARKLVYNLAITFVSAAVALLVGAILVLGLVGERLALSSWFWRATAALDENLDAIGLAIVALFLSLWIAGMVAWRYAGARPGQRPAERSYSRG
jgi:high-affinity nickel-transport protein